MIIIGLIVICLLFSIQTLALFSANLAEIITSTFEYTNSTSSGYKLINTVVTIISGYDLFNSENPLNALAVVPFVFLLLTIVAAVVLLVLLILRFSIKRPRKNYPFVIVSSFLAVMSIVSMSFVIALFCYCSETEVSTYMGLNRVQIATSYRTSAFIMLLVSAILMCVFSIGSLVTIIISSVQGSSAGLILNLNLSEYMVRGKESNPTDIDSSNLDVQKLDAIKQSHQLFVDGVLSEEEFNEIKKNLLNS